jgi:hypothetical protein
LKTIKMMLAAMVMALSGCQSGFWYDYQTGLRGDANPALLAKLNRARTICNGEVAKVPMASGIGGDRIFNACMVQQGFEVRSQ